MKKEISLTEIEAIGRDRWNAERPESGIQITDSGMVENLDLSGYNLSNATVNAITLLRVNLTETNFKKSKLAGIRLVRCTFNECDFSESDLDSAEIIGGSGDGANFESCKLSDASFSSVQPGDYEDDETDKLSLVETIFCNAEATEIGFYFCDMEYVRCQGIQASMATFAGVNLTGARFESHANDNPQKNRWEPTDLREATFDTSCVIISTCFDGADLSQAEFSCYNINTVSFRGSILRNATLRETRCLRTDFTDTDIYGADLGDADLREAVGLRQSRCYVRGARLPLEKKDIWSVLRSEYTGSRLIFILIFTSLFLTPLIVRTAGFVMLNRGQVELSDRMKTAHQSLEAYEESHSEQISALKAMFENYEWPFPEMIEVPIFVPILGLDKGFLYSALLVIPILLYQGLRGLLTWLVGRMSDEEDNTGYSPAFRPEPYPIEGNCIKRVKARSVWLLSHINSYGWLMHLHRFNKILILFTLTSFALNLIYWLSQSVWIPKGY